MSKSKNKPTGNQAPQRDFFQNVKLQSRLFFVAAFLLYANTLRHGFVLDDGILITENAFTQAGLRGIPDILTHDTFFGFFQREGMDELVAGGRYRPFSQVLFAVVYQFAGPNAFAFHLLTVLLYALACLVFYRAIIRLLAPGGERNGLLAAWAATALFVAHPIHTEVVANIKSCDEILAMTGAAAALYFALLARDRGQKKWLLASGVAFLAACLSKENAIAYAALIPLALWLFRPGKGVVAGSWPVWAAAVLFLVIRGSILPWDSLSGGAAPSELLNNPFLKYVDGSWVPFSMGEKLATIFYTLWKYAQLLVFPHPLTHDYYPRHIGILTFGNPLVWLSIALYGLLGFLAVRGLLRRERIALPLLMYLLPLGIVSNLLFPIGTNMSERFAFMPSAGVCLLAGWLLAHWQEKNPGRTWQVLVPVLLLFAAKTLLRNPAWASNEKLYATDASVSEKSIKLQTAYAQVLLDKARTAQSPIQTNSFAEDGLQRINRALELFPDFKTALIIRGGLYAVTQKFPEAVADYRAMLARDPDNPARKKALAGMLRDAARYYGQQKKDLNTALQHLTEAWTLYPEDPETARLTGVAHMVQGNREQALAWFGKAEAVAGDDADALWELGSSYLNFGSADKARELQQKAYQIDPTIVERVQE